MKLESYTVIVKERAILSRDDNRAIAEARGYGELLAHHIRTVESPLVLAVIDEITQNVQKLLKQRTIV